MSHVVYVRLACAACSAVIVACSTGCMIQPGHGQRYSSRDSVIQFMGASLSPHTRIEIQAYHPDCDRWERLAETTPELTAASLQRQPRLSAYPFTRSVWAVISSR